ncbi:hypothetical protein E2C01_030682 [Portunus trituberculatus]|uniref:Uncharacterized protein n=1 Tax=Portunus trituberculatus TaxID=210409 RepID=A0A5B7EW05_PORTR|nr:hypothetical protein [Portunus trituberculatus]
MISKATIPHFLTNRETHVITQNVQTQQRSGKDDHNLTLIISFLIRVAYESILPKYKKSSGQEKKMVHKIRPKSQMKYETTVICPEK